jgi:polyisoprenoid-binding protein YceI
MNRKIRFIAISPSSKNYGAQFNTMELPVCPSVTSRCLAQGDVPGADETWGKPKSFSSPSRAAHRFVEPGIYNAPPRKGKDPYFMNKLLAFAVCLLLAVTGALAAPRPLVRAGSHIGFSVKQMGVPVSGEFRRFDAAIDFDAANPGQSSASLKIEIGSLTTGIEDADAVAMDADWLDKEHAPHATFASSSIRALGGNRYEAKGTLTIRNRAREIAVPFAVEDRPDGKSVFTAALVIKRADFGIGGGMWNEGGLVAEEVPVSVRLLVAQPAAPPAAKSKH